MLDKNQKEIVELETGRYLVDGCPGSGKTKTLVERTNYLTDELDVSPHKILVVSFSRMAVEELQDRIKDDNVNIKTVHALCYHKINDYNIIMPDVVSAGQRKYFISKGIQKVGLEDVKIKDVELLIAKAQNMMVDTTGDKEIDKVWNFYNYLKKDNNLIDFGDMLAEGYKIIQGNNSGYTHVLVDETHDLSLIQHKIIEEIQNDNLFLLSSTSQAIYCWRCAYPKYIYNIHEWYPDIQKYNLTRNYRSKYLIVKFANRWSKIEMEPVKEEKGIVRYTGHYPNLQDEAEMIVSIINPEVDTCILFRTNWYSLEVEHALMKHGLTYTTLGNKSFYDMPEIQDMIAYLRLSIDVEDKDSLSRIYNRPNRYLGNKWKRKFDRKYTRDILHTLDKKFRGKPWWYAAQHDLYRLLDNNYKTDSPEEVISNVRKEYDEWWIYNSEDEYQLEDVASLERFQDLSAEFKSIEEFLEYCKKPVDEDSNIVIGTGHASKGLEFSHVHVAGVTEGIIPHAKSNNRAEEKRLLYVMFTRAINRLTYSSATYEKFNQLSSFLKED